MLLCPICKSVAQELDRTGDATGFDCERDGKFKVADTVFAELSKGHCIPIIAVTSYVLSGEEQKARAAGCDDYVPKPFSRRQLLAKIRHYLQ